MDSPQNFNSELIKGLMGMDLGETLLTFFTQTGLAEHLLPRSWNRAEDGRGGKAEDLSGQGASPGLPRISRIRLGGPPPHSSAAEPQSRYRDARSQPRRSSAKCQYVLETDGLERAVPAPPHRSRQREPGNSAKPIPRPPAQAGRAPGSPRHTAPPPKDGRHQAPPRKTGWPRRAQCAQAAG